MIWRTPKRKGRNHDVSERNKHGKTEATVTKGTGHLWTGCRSFCVSTPNHHCLPCLPSNLFFVPFPGTLFSMHVGLRDKQSQITEVPESVMPANEKMTFCRSGWQGVLNQTRQRTGSMAWKPETRQTAQVRQLKETDTTEKEKSKLAARESVVLGTSSWTQMSVYKRQWRISRCESQFQGRTYVWNPVTGKIHAIYTNMFAISRHPAQPSRKDRVRPLVLFVLVAVLFSVLWWPTTYLCMLCAEYRCLCAAQTTCLASLLSGPGATPAWIRN